MDDRYWEDQRKAQQQREEQERQERERLQRNASIETQRRNAEALQAQQQQRTSTPGWSC